MPWNDEVILISEGKLIEDDLGQQEKTKEELKVLCNEKSVGRFEFYQAARAGFKPQLILEIHSFENNNPFEIIFKNKKYSVIKEYTSKDITELTCEEIKNESPKSNRKSGGAYASSWVKSKEKGKIKIHNKKHYRLTHLLERGHAKRNGGRTKAMPHIEPVEQFVIETFPKKLEERLGR